MTIVDSYRRHDIELLLRRLYNFECQLGHACHVQGCDKPAVYTCPRCRQIGIQSPYFCDQEHFNDEWATHKKVHLGYFNEKWKRRPMHDAPRGTTRRVRFAKDVD